MKPDETFHMEKKTMQCYEKNPFSSIKYICHNTQLKNLYKFMPMNINQQIITLNIHKPPDSDIFHVFFNF